MTSLILIEGPANSGKTTIAWKVFLELKKYASAVRYWNAYGEEEFPVEKIAEDDEGRSAQFYALFTIRGRVYAISTPGDNRPKVEGSINDKVHEGGVKWGRECVRADVHVQCANTAVGTVANYVNAICDVMPNRRFVVAEYPTYEAVANDIIKCVVEP